MNLVLMQAGYPPAIIARVNRQQYYRVLSQADGRNFAPLLARTGKLEAIQRGRIWHTAQRALDFL